MIGESTGKHVQGKTMKMNRTKTAIFLKSQPGSQNLIVKFIIERYPMYKIEIWLDKPSSMSFLEAASKSTTLSLKNIFLLLDVFGLCAFLLYSFSFWDQTLSWWFRLFLANISLSWVGICSMWGISWIKSACSIFAWCFLLLLQCWKRNSFVLNELNKNKPRLE